MALYCFRTSYSLATHVLRPCYAMHGTDRAYQVLTWGARVPTVRVARMVGSPLSSFAPATRCRVLT
eukprot:3941705-Rhodomonas_salina.5